MNTPAPDTPEIFTKSVPFQATRAFSPLTRATPVVAAPFTVSANPPVVSLLMMYHLLVLGTIRLRAAVMAPLTLRIAYCDVVELMLVPELVP